MAIAAVAGQEGGAGNASGASSQAYTFAGNVTAGSLIVIGAHRYNSDNAQHTFVAGNCTKTAGTSTIDTPTLDRAQDLNIGVIWYSDAIFSALVTGSGSLTMTVAGGQAGSFWMVPGGEYTGSWDSSRLEASNGGTAVIGSTPAVSGNGTSAGAGLFWGLLGSDGSSTVTITPEAAFTQVYEEQSASTKLIGGAERQIVAVGTTDQAEWTLSGIWTGWSALLAVYKEAGGGGATTRGNPFNAGNAFNGGRTFAGILRRNATIFLPPRRKLVIARHLPKAA